MSTQTMYLPYGFMDPYSQAFPHHRDHIGYPHRYYPSWEVAPAQVKRDADEASSLLRPSPYDKSFNNLFPTECNGCCSYPYSPGYCSFLPPQPIIQPPPLYYHGLYPPYPNAYPAHFVPPPHYSVDQARYDYEKPRGQHCCGCPNHTCRQKKDEQTMRIEEDKPELLTKSADSSPLISLPNYPCPPVWVPPVDMKDKDSNKSLQSYPDARGWWIPLDENNIKVLKQCEKEKAKENEYGEGKKMHFPMPFIWMPGYNQPEEVKQDLKESNASPKCAEDLPSKLKMVPVKPLQNENRDDKPGLAESESESQAKESKLKKIIPVKQIEEISEPKPSECKKVNEEDGADEKTSTLEQDEEKSGKNGKTKKQASQVKSSKLPPVCLRVDPLPRRKSGNGAYKVEEKVHQERSAEGLGDMNEYIKETLETKKTEAVKVADRPINDTAKKGVKVEDRVPVNAPDDVLGKPVEANLKEQSGAVVTSKSERGVMENVGQGKENNKTMSDADAAIFIQSAYRGFQVRRLDPLKKLRQIAIIREQVGDVRNAILCLETTLKQQQDEKQRILIGETIMSLLLQLDTIQGLHPNVREIRKSVARELVFLQEKLDSLAKGKEQIDFGARETSKVETYDGNQQAVCSIEPVLTDQPSTAEESIQSSFGKGTVAKHFSEDRQSNSAGTRSLVTKEGEVASLVPKDEVANSVFEGSRGTTLEKEELVSDKGLLATSQVLGEETGYYHEETDGPSLTKDMAAAAIEEVPSVRDESADSGDDQLKQADQKMEELTEVPLMEKWTLAPDNSQGLQPMRVLEGLEPKEERSQETLQIGDSLVKNENEETEHISNPEFLPLTAKDGELVSEKKEPSMLYIKPHLEEPTMIPMEKKGTGPVGDFTVRRGFDASSFSGISNPEVICPLGAVEETETREEGSPRTPRSDDKIEKVVETEHSSNPENFEPSSAQDGELVSAVQESHVEYVGPCTEQAKPAMVPEGRSNGPINPASLQEDEHDGWPELVADGKNSSMSEHQVSLGTSDSDDQSYEENSETAAADVCLPPAEFNLEQELMKKKDEIDSGSELAIGSICLPTRPPDRLMNAETMKGEDEHIDNGNPRKHLDVCCKELKKKETKLAEENMELKDMLVKMLESGKEQLAVISDLNGRVKDLERKLAQKKKLRMKRHRTVKSAAAA